ncbi:MAG: hypothetical protein JNG89_09940 [Planctomycetaceae bacterium]|nr:hypothetical protein [Planctomycetaceae bacterium]
MSVEAMIKSIRENCVKNKGGYVPYSQCVQPTKALIESMPATKGGICRALACRWIAEHSKDSSLWNVLFAPGSTNVKQAVIANTMISFIEGVTTSGSMQNKSVQNPQNLSGGNYQDLVMDKYLGMYGLIRRNICGDIITGYQTRTAGLNVAQSIINRMTPTYLNTKSGCYIHLYIGGKGAHSCAAWVGEDVAFFDPNFGEFYFDKHANFEKFFLYMWDRSGYIKSFNSFQLDAYAKKMRR